MAAPILSYEGLGLVQGSGWLFQDLDIYVGERDRLALIGRNGAGKTTLLKLLAGQIDATTMGIGSFAAIDDDPNVETLIGVDAFWRAAPVLLLLAHRRLAPTLVHLIG